MEAADFEFMTDCLTRDMLSILVEEREMTIAMAFETLYNSDTYQMMLNPASGLYFQSPRYVLAYLDKELTQGKLGSASFSDIQ